MAHPSQQPAPPAPASDDRFISLRVCPSCGHDLGMSGGDGAICPECGNMCAVLADADQHAAGTAGPAGGAPALGSHAMKGFAFMLIQGVGTRIVAFACQMWLAHLLVPQHFGVMALADSIATFANVLQLIGVREVLVSRHKRLHLWVNAGFWIMTTTGWATGAIVAAAGLVARAQNKPDLGGLLLFIALSIPLSSMSVVAEAKLQAQLRFKYLAAVIGTWAMLLPILMVVCALLGMGAYSFVVPRVVVAALRLFLSHRAARLNLSWNPQFRRWRSIVGTSLLFFITSIVLTVVQIGDRPLLGAAVDERTLGLYAFAFAFSMQTIMIIAVNLQGVLLATLTKLNDEPARQLKAFIRASRVLAAIVTPICLLQAAASASLVHTLFEYDKWSDAVPPMQVLALGMVFLGSYCPAQAMMEAQRRFKTKLKVAIVHVLAFLVLVPAGILLGFRYGNGQLGGALGAAVGVSATLVLVSPLWGYIAIRNLGGTLADTLGIVARPLIAGGLATGLGLAAAALAGHAAAGHSALGYPLEHWARLFTVCAATGLAYIPLMRLLMPGECRELGGKIAAIASRVWAPGGAAIRRVCGVLPA